MQFSLGATQTGTPAAEQDVVILGTGPAGLAAAVYAARADRKPLVLAGPDLGGQVALTNTVENYPGFPEGVGGGDLFSLFQKQAERFGAVVDFSTANEVDLSVHPFRILADTGEYRAKTLIVATGASPRRLGVPGEDTVARQRRLLLRHLRRSLLPRENVMVVGGGDSALEEGIFLTRYVSQATIIHRRNELRAGTLLQERAQRATKKSVSCWRP